MSGKNASSLRREILPIGLILLAAVTLRAVYLLEYKAHIPYYYRVTLDSAYYDAWAQRVAEGKGYGPMPFYMAPLYPYFLALIYKIAGHNYPIIYLLQAVLGTINTILVYIIGRKLISRAVGLVASGLVLIYSPLIYLETKLLTEILAITLNLTSILALIYATERQSASMFLASGVAFGISALCRPAALIMALLAVLWLLLKYKSNNRTICYTALLLIGVVIPIIPVTARNYFIGKDFALLSTNAGIVFAQGNSEYATGISTPLPGFSGTILTQQQEEMAQASSALGRQVKPSESSAYWFRLALSFICEHPFEYLKLLGRKVIWSLHNRESPCSYNIYYEREYVPILRWLALPFPLLAGLGLFGWKRLRDRQVSILGLYILSIFLSLMIFSVSSRYRAPMVPALAIFSGYGLLEATKLVLRRDIRGTICFILCIALMFLPSLVRFPTPTVTAEAPTNMGWSYMEQGKVKEAIVQFKRALEMNPEFSHAHNNLGIALARQGKIDEAIAEYEEALRLTPNYPEAHFNLGDALVRKGRLDDAIAHYQASIQLRPDYAPTRVHLGNALLLKGLYDEAIANYQKALQLDPEVPDARHNLEVAIATKNLLEGSSKKSKQNLAIEHYNRANGLLREGKFDEAAKEYKKALAFDPKFGRAHNNLAVALFMSGRYAEAWNEVMLAKKYGAEPNPNFLRGLSEKMQKP